MLRMLKLDHIARGIFTWPIPYWSGENTPGYMVDLKEIHGKDPPNFQLFIFC